MRGASAAPQRRRVRVRMILSARIGQSLIRVSPSPIPISNELAVIFASRGLTMMTGPFEITSAYDRGMELIAADVRRRRDELSYDADDIKLARRRGLVLPDY